MKKNKKSVFKEKRNNAIFQRSLNGESARKIAATLRPKIHWTTVSKIIKMCRRIAENEDKRIWDSNYALLAKENGTR